MMPKDEKLIAELTEISNSFFSKESIDKVAEVLTTWTTEEKSRFIQLKQENEKVILEIGLFTKSILVDVTYQHDQIKIFTIRLASVIGTYLAESDQKLEATFYTNGDINLSYSASNPAARTSLKTYAELVRSLISGEISQ